MKFALLKDRLDRMPMLKALLPFAAGIVAASCGTLPLWFLAGAFVCCGVAALGWRSSVWTVALLVVSGFGMAQLRTSQTTVPLHVRTLYELDIEGIPALHGQYGSAEARVRAWRHPRSGRWYPSDTRLQLHTDSVTLLYGGERILCSGYVRPLHNGSKSYQRLMRRRGYSGMLWVGKNTLLERRVGRGDSFHQRAAERLRRLPMPEERKAVVEAMAAGDRSGITPTLRTAYARSGLTHLLAVSGLHTGIVFVLINLLLFWMPVLRRGHLWRNLLVVTAIWIYVAAVGFPPSAVRAAVMCTLLQTALATTSDYVGLNTLAAAAFGMLLWNPQWIGDISFQLSFIAVAALMAWSVPLCRRLHTRFRWVNYLVDGCVVCLVSTAATAPLVSHAFGIIPLLGVIVSPAAIALASVVVSCGVVWMLLPVGWLAPLVGGVAGGAAGAITFLARLIDRMPHGVLPFRLDGWAVAGIYLLFVVGTLLLWCREPEKKLTLRGVDA